MEKTNEGPDPEKTFTHLKSLFLRENECFGHVYTWGQANNAYVNIGYILPEEMHSIIGKMSVNDRRHLVRMISYFEIHMRPLSHMLNANDDTLGKIYIDWAWSHFSILIMFGLAELAVRCEQGLNPGEILTNKGEKIKSLFNKHLNIEEKDSIVRRYRQDDRRLGKLRISCFNDVLDDMWKKIRSEFVHEGGVESAPLERTTFADGGERDGIPIISVLEEVAVYEWLRIAWQVIFSVFGCKEKIESEPLKK